MAIDIRATVTCSLGTLISASISDDYVQGTGLIKCRGTCQISGLITPALGTAVTFSYTKEGITRVVPRKLRVLSSFADPFRRTTTVELGCKLTYLQDKQESLKWDAFEDPENSDLTEEDLEIITAPIRASFIAQKCCAELGIGGSPSLTNTFSIKEFDFSAGYAAVLSDLMVSESLCGYLDYNEVLRVFPLNQAGGTGPVLDGTKVIDLGPIGVGALPGEAVTVSYSTLRLKNAAVSEEAAIEQSEAEPDPEAPEEEEAEGTSEVRPKSSLWSGSSASNRHSIYIGYTYGNKPAIKEYKITDTKKESTTYREIEKPDGETITVPRRRVTVEETNSAAVLGALVTEYLQNGIYIDNRSIEKTRVEDFYYDKYGNEVLYVSTVTGSRLFLVGSMGVPFVFSLNDYVPINYIDASEPLERVVRSTVTLGDFQRVETRVYGNWAETIAGQQSIAAARDSFKKSSDVISYLNSVLFGVNRLSLLDFSIVTQRRTAPQEAPAKEDIINAENAEGSEDSNQDDGVLDDEAVDTGEKAADPAGNYRVESSAELELSLGALSAERRIDLSMPFAPDDRFFKSGDKYFAVRSDAASKARIYGLAQNRLLLGNRSGMNIQTLPELLPEAPFAPFIVQANGLSAMYRTNGTSWQMSADGILVSTDALFYGAVGGTGEFWFPVSPGVTALPATPAVTDGVMTVEAVVPVWNESIATEANMRIGAAVAAYDYALVEEAAKAVLVKAGITCAVERAIYAPLGTVTCDAQAVTLSGITSAALEITAVDITTEPLLPQVVSDDYSLVISQADVATTAGLPTLGGTFTYALTVAYGTALVQAPAVTLTASNDVILPLGPVGVAVSATADLDESLDLLSASINALAANVLLLGPVNLNNPQNPAAVTAAAPAPDLAGSFTFILSMAAVDASVAAVEFASDTVYGMASVEILVEATASTGIDIPAEDIDAIQVSATSSRAALIECNADGTECWFHPGSGNAIAAAASVALVNVDAAGGTALIGSNIQVAVTVSDVVVTNGDSFSPSLVRVFGAAPAVSLSFGVPYLVLCNSNSIQDDAIAVNLIIPYGNSNAGSYLLRDVADFTTSNQKDAYIYLPEGYSYVDWAGSSAASAVSSLLGGSVIYKTTTLSLEDFTPGVGTVTVELYTYISSGFANRGKIVTGYLSSGTARVSEYFFNSGGSASFANFVWGKP